MSSNNKPNVFIGSSREAIPYANEVCTQLERVCQVNPWYVGVFQANEYTMESLERELDSNDFGVFIFAAEDLAIIRDKTVFITRDNTMFEMGLFWGKLRRGRVFCIIPSEIPKNKELEGKAVTEFHLPSDLDGITLLRYIKRDDDKLALSVLTACNAIAKVIEKDKKFKDDPRFLKEMIGRKQSILHFLWEYLKGVPRPSASDRYSAATEAIRNSFLLPDGHRILGAALWKKTDETHISQVAGNVGKGKIFHINDNNGKTDEDQKILVLDVYNSGTWSFFTRLEIAKVYVLCYSLDKDHVLSIHINGNRELDSFELKFIVEVVNEELFATIKYLVGGDSI